jgi:hypothetical protein
VAENAVLISGLFNNPQHDPVTHWLVAVQDPPTAQLVPLEQVDKVTVGNTPE